MDTGFFSRNVVWGWEIAFVGRENVKNIQKTNKICYFVCVCVCVCVGGGGGGGGGEYKT